MRIARSPRRRLGAIIILLCLTAATSQAQTFSVLASFNGANGMTPNGVVQGADGSFYGAAQGGGPNKAGTVFRFTPGGGLTVLYPFEANLTHGADPQRQLVAAADGNLYGLTVYGGSGACAFQAMVVGCGTVFRITPAGALTTFYSFSAADGANPTGLIQGNDGNFYGTTGTTSATCTNSCGTIFRLTPAGALTTLHTFTGSDGSGPAALTQASDGSFYGITAAGGTGASCTGGCGTVFKLAGGTLTTLYSFGISGFTDGWTPASVIQGADGNLYGTTVNGGDTTAVDGITTGLGTVFRITPAGALTTLYKFNLAGGALPAFLTEGSDGNFYGTTGNGGQGTHAVGTLYRITPAGVLTTLHTFSGSDGGGGTLSPMVKGADGNLYGASFGGGANGDGTVFSLSFGSAPTTLPSITPNGGIVSGASFQAGIAPGSWITITGANLSPVMDTWANAIVNGNLPQSLDGVSVNVSGAPAYIYYLSSTQINAVAPNVGTGPVQVTVTTPEGTSAPATVTSQAEQPAFFQWGAYAVATTLNYALAVKNGTFSGVATTPAKPGDVIILWGTGFGPTSPAAPMGALVPSGTTYNTAAQVSVKVGGADATIFGAALASGYAALYQVAIQIPASLSNGDYPVVATIDGVSSPATTLITVQQ